MARTPKPWYWEARDGWYIRRGNEHVLLARGKKSKAEATRVFHTLMATGRTAPAPAIAPARVMDIVLTFLADAASRARANEIEVSTVGDYSGRLGRFAAELGAEDAAKLPAHVAQQWLAATRGGPTWKADVAATIRMAWRLAKRRGLIPIDPMADLKSPRRERRETFISGEVVDRLIAATMNPAIRDLLTILKETGCRPKEAARVEAAHLDLGRALWSLPGKTTRKTGAKVVAHLTPTAVALCRLLAEAHPTGPIFLNSHGRPWSRSAIDKQVQAARGRAGLGKEAVAYALRHTFATDALASGVPDATVAALLNHRGTAMVHAHYSHLTERHGHLKDALKKVRPDEPGSEPGR